MYKKTINYTDFNGIDHKEDFYFHLSESEIVTINSFTGGGLKPFFERIANTQDQKEIVNLFRELILKSYGVKSDDGKRFIKSQELRDAFEQTNAYNELFMLLVTNEKEAVNFVNNIIPAKLLDDAKKLEANTTPIPNND